MGGQSDDISFKKGPNDFTVCIGKKSEGIVTKLFFFVWGRLALSSRAHPLLFHMRVASTGPPMRCVQNFNWTWPQARPLHFLVKFLILTENGNINKYLYFSLKTLSGKALSRILNANIDDSLRQRKSYSSILL